MSNYISTRGIKLLHVIHNGFTFDMLPELKKRHPNLKVIVTMFNDRVPEYFERSVSDAKYIDIFSSDNMIVTDHYKKLLGDSKQLVTIPNGINCYDVFNPKLFNRQQSRSSLGVEDDELAIFFIGRLSEEKNPDVFVEVAKRMLVDKKATKLKFFMIGDGPMRQVLEKSILAIKSKNIQYLGYMASADVSKYLASADVFVLPSSIEGFPLSLLEAMSMGVVSIASHVGAVPDVIKNGENGFVISPPGSINAIVKVLDVLRKDPQKVAKVKNIAREDIEKKYSNKLLGENYAKMYERVIK